MTDIKNPFAQSLEAIISSVTSTGFSEQVSSTDVFIPVADFKEPENFTELVDESQILKEKRDAWLKEREGVFTGSCLWKLVKTSDVTDSLPSKDIIEVYEEIKDELSDNDKSLVSGFYKPSSINKLIKPLKVNSDEAKALQIHFDKDFLSTGAITYIEETAISRLSTRPHRELYAQQILWGREQEKHAIEALKADLEDNNLTVELSKINNDQVFEVVIPDVFGRTSDGFIDINNTEYVLEVKCPDPLTHTEYMKIEDAKSLKEVMPDYYYQVQGYFLRNNIKGCLFVSYDPEYKGGIKERRLHYCIVERDEKTIGLSESVLMKAKTYRDKFLAELLIKANKSKITKSKTVSILAGIDDIIDEVIPYFTSDEKLLAIKPATNGKEDQDQDNAGKTSEIPDFF